MTKKVLITGASGQLGNELQRTVSGSIEIIALDSTKLDISNAQTVNDIIERVRPDWIINAAAYTAVDKAEEEPDVAFAVNRDGAFHLAVAAKSIDAKMIQISTDFVFDGKQNTPYQLESYPNPLCVYGLSKQAGDEAVLSELGDKCIIVRTSWVYSAHGNNFVKSMLRLMSEKKELGIVMDQVGSPTWAHDLACAIWKMLEKNMSGYFHWSDYGVASWYDFAYSIYEEASLLGLIDNKCEIRPISTEEYPALAERPNYSVLDKKHTVLELGVMPNHWRVSLKCMLKELRTRRALSQGLNNAVT